MPLQKAGHAWVVFDAAYGTTRPTRTRLLSTSSPTSD